MRARLRSRFVSTSGWVTSLDGSLLTDVAWGRRHALILMVAAVNGTVAVIVAAADRGGGLWPQAGVLAGCLAFGAAYRRPRELAMVDGRWVMVKGPQLSGRYGELGLHSSIARGCGLA